jgi:hypothetical protein
MIRKLLILPVVALLFATMSLSTLTSCEKDPADLNDTITFEELNAPYTVITPTVAPTKTTSLTFYARSTVMSNSGGSVDVFLDGNYVNSMHVPLMVSMISVQPGVLVPSQLQQLLATNRKWPSKPH